VQIHVHMTPRDPHEAHRASTPLELFVDLAFVVAVAQAAGSLHHALVEDHLGDVLLGFPITFFAIWWAWMNFTWFASAFDCDDVLYRLAVFAQMSGVLVLAAGIPRAFNDMDFVIPVIGYVIMRLAMVTQWLRAAASDPSARRTATRYAIGVALVQVGWVARLFLHDAASVILFVVLVIAELLVPAWAERAGATPWHPRHMAERYGLFTIIVLGESVLGATVAVQGALDAEGAIGDLAPVIIGGLLTVFSMWWIYFGLPSERLVDRARDGKATAAFGWGYGHYLIFGTAAAAGASLAVAVDQAVGKSHLSARGFGLAVTVPVALYVVTCWLLHRGAKPAGVMRDWGPLVAAAAVLATTLTPEPVLLTGLVLALTVAVGIVTGADEPVPAADGHSAPAVERSTR
jgi:low temperature requirement protein LtrA